MPKYSLRNPETQTKVQLRVGCARLIFNDIYTIYWRLGACIMTCFDLRNDSKGLLKGHIFFAGRCPAPRWGWRRRPPIVQVVCESVPFSM